MSGRLVRCFDHLCLIKAIGEDLLQSGTVVGVGGEVQADSRDRGRLGMARPGDEIDDIDNWAARSETHGDAMQRVLQFGGVFRVDVARDLAERAYLTVQLVTEDHFRNI
jgi:hypothetical protein